MEQLPSVALRRDADLVDGKRDTIYYYLVCTALVLPGGSKATNSYHADFIDDA